MKKLNKEDRKFHKKYTLYYMSKRIEKRFESIFSKMDNSVLDYADKVDVFFNVRYYVFGEISYLLETAKTIEEFDVIQKSIDKHIENYIDNKFVLGLILEKIY